jgi:hypothetical protein
MSDFSSVSARSGAATAPGRDQKAFMNIKSLLEQAVFFGSDQTNPVSFNVNQEFAHIGEAAVDVSFDILRSGNLRRLGFECEPLNSVKAFRTGR